MVSGRSWLQSLKERVLRKKVNRLFRRKKHSVLAEDLEARLLLTAPYSADDTYDADWYAGTTVDAQSGVLVNDTDYDGDPLTASVYDYPTYGSVSLNSDGSFTYYSYPGYLGIDTFTYQAFDGTEYGNVSTLTLRRQSSFNSASLTPSGAPP